MGQKRAHIFLPEDLLADIDKLVGKGKRSGLITDILRHEVRRRRLMQILGQDDPVWKDEDHPKLKDGAYAWVRQRRDEDDKHAREKLRDWLSPRE